jgi:hypothetical protein
MLSMAHKRNVLAKHMVICGIFTMMGSFQSCDYVFPFVVYPVFRVITTSIGA